MSPVSSEPQQDRTAAETVLFEQIDRSEDGMDRAEDEVDRTERATGLDREIAKTVLQAIRDSPPGPVSKAQIMKQYGIGKELATDIFDQLVSEQVLTRQPNGRYMR